MNYGSTNSGDRDAIKSDGTVILHAAAVGCTLPAGTYYFPLGSSNAPTPAETPVASAHLAWSAAFAATITVETANFPRFRGGKDHGPDDVTDYDSTAGNWIPENPSTAIVGFVGTDNSSTAATVTAGGTHAGGCTFQLGNLGTRRARIKLVVTVAGTCRCNTFGKAGG